VEKVVERQQSGDKLWLLVPSFRKQTRRSARVCSSTVGFLVLLVLLPASGVADAATLEGTVLDPTGRAIPHARVTVLRSLVAFDERQSDVRGDFKFENLAEGAYQVVARAPGFSSPPVNVELLEGKPQIVDLHLQLSALTQQVVVSASLGTSLVPQIGSSVSVETQHDIEDRGAQNAFEGLRGIPGVEVTQSGRHGGITSAFIRGGNSNYNLVMVDGMEVNQFGGDFDLASLPADGVDRIEVTRGPESALYGSNAVTGVINIMTRRGEGPPHFTGLAEGGSFTTRRFSTGGSGLTQGFSWAYDLSRLDSGGTVENDRYRDQSVFLSLGYRRSPRRTVDFHLLGNANDAGAPGPYGSDPDHLFPGIDKTSRDKQNLFGYVGTYSEQFSARFRQVVSGSVVTNDYYFRSPFGDSFSNNLRGVVSTRSEMTITNRDFLVAGFEYNREQTENTFITDGAGNPFLLPRTSLAYFAENRWSPTNRVFVIAGLRVDNLRRRQLPADSFGSRPPLPSESILKVNPRVSVAYLLRESQGGWLDVTRLHGSFGTGIRAPNGFELAFTNNPHLKPERSISFDSGVEQRFFNSRAVLDLTYFFNRFDDQIVVLGGSLTNLSSFISDNLGNSQAQGLETSFRLQPTRSLQISAEYTLLDTSILALAGSSVVQAPFHVGQQLFRRPRHSGACNLTWQRGRLMLNTGATIRGSVLDLEPNLGTFACSLGLQCLFTNKGYIRADSGFSYRLSPRVELYGRLNNFLNQKYEEAFGFPALPLNFLAGVRFTLPHE
jgi:outer membrane cobalamin receptor